jgi:pseudouridine-5'-phosphate glycosidase
MANTIPNFDAMTQKDLMAFWSKYHRASRKDAEALVGDRRKGFTTIAATLANYACNKACAMGLRVKGEIERAQTYEHACDLSYNRLPEDLRW